MDIKKLKIANKDSHLITLKNNNIELQLLDIGATVYSLKTKDRNGKLKNIVLQYDDINLYAKILRIMVLVLVGLPVGLKMVSLC